ncbi:hypothetical protein DPEC_G00220260 [Dallia pectoralis]|uniref:Uncharacterized protein n=1 Tax=Dallia pectoralis TaxID=75939 RepID=A0ACC2G380_DALPE|nr:hypothetical protein DPEC_G00220260 [Dallia pectoralis]
MWSSPRTLITVAMTYEAVSSDAMLLPDGPMSSGRWASSRRTAAPGSAAPFPQAEQHAVLASCTFDWNRPHHGPGQAPATVAKYLPPRLRLPVRRDQFKWGWQ